MNPKRLRRLLSSAICITETAFLYCNSRSSHSVDGDFTNRRNAMSNQSGIPSRDVNFTAKPPINDSLDPCS